MEPLTALVAEYGDAPAFAGKVAALSPRYSAFRRTRGDGNCFYRALWFGLAEALVARGEAPARNAVVTRLRQSRSKLIAAGIQDLVFEDALDLLADMLNAIAVTGDPLTLAALEGNARDDVPSNMIVMFLRLLTSAEMKTRADFFAPFVLDDEPTVAAFCARRVEPMGEEADHAHAVALADALGVAARVVYLDLSPGETANVIDFDPAGGVVGAATGAAPPRVTLLYRPGHYDIVYEAEGPAVVAAGLDTGSGAGGG